MIHTVIGDILSVTTGIIVHGVNCQGRMASGVAKVISDRYPEVKTEYEVLSNKVRHKPDLLGFIGSVRVAPKLIIVNAFTQEWYGNVPHKRYVSYDAIDECFRQVVALQSAENEYLPICFPRIGAGLGGGDWDIIKVIIDKALNPFVGGYLYELK